MSCKHVFIIFVDTSVEEAGDVDDTEDLPADKDTETEESESSSRPQTPCSASKFALVKEKTALLLLSCSAIALSECTKCICCVWAWLY